LGVLSDDDSVRCNPDAAIFLDHLAQEKRAGRLMGPRPFWVAAERLPMVQTVYPETAIDPPLTPPVAELRRTWERPDAVRELVRGRIEICGPVTAAELAGWLGLPQTEIDPALLGLEAEGFVLRGKFRP